MAVKGASRQEINLALVKKVIRLCRKGGDASSTLQVLRERCGLKKTILLLDEEAKGEFENLAEILFDGMEIWVMVLMSPKLAQIGFSVLSRKTLPVEVARKLLGQIKIVDFKYREAVRQNCLKCLRAA